MDLREPIEPLFRIAQMGLAYEASEDKIVLIAQEFVPQSEDEHEEEDDGDTADFGFFDADDGDPKIVRMWCSREQMRALGLRAMDTVKSGRPDAKQNGRIIFYWT